MSPVLIFIGLVTAALGLAVAGEENEPENGRKKANETEDGEHRLGGPGGGGTRQPGSASDGDHGKRGVNVPPGMEHEDLGASVGGEPGDNRGGEPDAPKGGGEAEPVIEPKPAAKASPKKRAKKTVENPADKEDENE